MARVQDLPTVTVDDLAGRAPEIVRNLREVTVIMDNGRIVASLVPQPSLDTLAGFMTVLEAMQTQAEIAKEMVRLEARSMNIEVEEFHYPT